jgi:hypothetical protein
MALVAVCIFDALLRNLLFPPLDSRAARDSHSKVSLISMTHRKDGSQHESPTASIPASQESSNLETWPGPAVGYSCRTCNNETHSVQGAFTGAQRTMNGRQQETKDDLQA